MLGEGRHFYNFTNSDFHFKTSGTNSSGYYPSEYSRNYTLVNPGIDGIFDYKDVVAGMRSGNSFAVYGDLINALDFTASSGTNSAVAGSDLNAKNGEKVNLTIRFKSPSTNNYTEFTDHDTTVTNQVTVDHVDLICGEITGTLDASEYDKATNETTSVIKTFSKAEWGEPDAEGYYTINYEVAADTSKYYRLRGTNLAKGTEGYTDAEGNPLKDTAYNSSTVTDFSTRVNRLNDRNYKSLWFYSNPIFVYTTVSDDATLSDLSISQGTLTPAFESGTKLYTAEVANDVDTIEVVPVANNINSKVKVEGVEVVTGAAISLSEGTNEINIQVTAQDGITTLDYVVSVIKGNGNVISPVIVSQTANYVTGSAITFTIGYGDKATAVDKIYVNGNELPVSYYDINGTTLILTNEYLSSLGKGVYSIAVSYNDGTSISDKLSFTISPDEIPKPEVPVSYTVTFLDWNGTILKMDSVNKGGEATAPTNLIREGYTFTGWNKPFNNITSNLSVMAQYSQNSTNGGYSGDATESSSTSTNHIEVITADIKQGKNDNTVSQISIERTTRDDGKKADSVIFGEESAYETVKNLKEKKDDTASILIPDEKDEVIDTMINLSSKALDELSAGEINLQIKTQEAEISLSKETLSKISKESDSDLYFRVVLVTKEKEKNDLKKEAIMAVSLANGSTKGSADLIGNPVTIETNRTSLESDITLPLSQNQIPTNSKEREAYFKQLAVYIKHSDGDEELIQGEIVEVSKGNFGIRFHINKFSSFAIVKTDAFLKSSECYINKVMVPTKAKMKGSNITATVSSKVSRINVKLTVSEKAVWELYSDKACTKVVENHRLKLKTGVNKVYIKVTAEDGTAKMYKLTVSRSKNKKTEVKKVATQDNIAIKDITKVTAVE
jgi:hypothetical protein